MVLKWCWGWGDSSFALPLVAINQSWESRLLAVKGPRGGSLREGKKGEESEEGESRG